MASGLLSIRPRLALALGNGTMGFDLSPDGNDVVFASLQHEVWELCTVSLYGGEPATLPAGTGHKVDPKWSPAGDRFACVLIPAEGGPRVCTVPLAGGEPTPVAPQAGPSWQPEWSPEGDRLAFVAAPAGVPELWLWTADTGTARPIAPGPLRGPTWSPDGSWICYLAGADPEDLALCYVSGWGGGTPRQLTGGISGVSKPRWSPAGRQIAVTLAGPRRSVAIVSAATGRISPVAGAGLEQWDPVWSSNGAAVAYRSATAEGVGLELRNLADGRATRLARPDGLATAPLFTPGKPRAVYAWSRNNEPAELYVQIVAGGHPQRLTQRGLEGASSLALPRTVALPGTGRAFLLGRPDRAAVLWAAGPGEGSAWNPAVQDLVASGIAVLVVELPRTGEAPQALAEGAAYLKAAGADQIALVLDGAATRSSLAACTVLDPWAAFAARTPELWPVAPPSAEGGGGADLPPALEQSGLPAIWLLARNDPLQPGAQAMVNAALGRGQPGCVMAFPAPGGLLSAQHIAIAHEALVRYLFQQLRGGVQHGEA